MHRERRTQRKKVPCTNTLGPFCGSDGCQSMSDAILMNTRSLLFIRSNSIDSARNRVL